MPIARSKNIRRFDSKSSDATNANMRRTPNVDLERTPENDDDRKEQLKQRLIESLLDRANGPIDARGSECDPISLDPPRSDTVDDHAHFAAYVWGVISNHGIISREAHAKCARLVGKPVVTALEHFDAPDALLTPDGDLKKLRVTATCHHPSDISKLDRIAQRPPSVLIFIPDALLIPTNVTILLHRPHWTCDFWVMQLTYDEYPGFCLRRVLSNQELQLMLLHAHTPTQYEAPTLMMTDDDSSVHTVHTSHNNTENNDHMVCP